METSAATREESGTSRLQRSSQELVGILRDDEHDQPTCLLRLQGWRDEELGEAVAAGNAHRLAPGFCAIGATAVAVTGSWVVAVALMATAVIGIVARNHPVEAIYNSFASRTRRGTIPRNRAAKRLGCFLGTAFLGASAASFLLGATVAGQVLAAIFAAVAWFVAVTNICVPSAIFVMLFGTTRSTARRLI